VFTNVFFEKTVLITGGGGFLGRGLCVAFANAGARVIVVDVNFESSASVAEQINASSPGLAIAIECDVSNSSSVKKTIDDIEGQNIRIDALVNNAATKTSNLENFFEPFETYKLDTWHQVNAVNIDGMFLVAQAVGNHMIQNEIKGSITQISSIYGVVSPNQRIYEGSIYNGRNINTPAVYAVSKAGVIALSKYLAAYWGENSIRVNTLSPGGVFSGQNDVFVDSYSQLVPMKRMANPDEIFGAALFLASDQASYITGQNIVVDGGLSTW
jgi:NAD(P)-dependent dehydrogenase (short-subunit alcohol dehydrogenase family)